MDAICFMTNFSTAVMHQLKIVDKKEGTGGNIHQYYKQALLAIIRETFSINKFFVMINHRGAHYMHFDKESPYSSALNSAPKKKTFLDGFLP
jgi:hypothetical protein